MRAMNLGRGEGGGGYSVKREDVQGRARLGTKGALLGRAEAKVEPAILSSDDGRESSRRVGAGE